MEHEEVAQNPPPPPPRKRGRPKGSKNSKKRDSFDGYQFLPTTNYLSDTVRKSTRSHTQSSFNGMESDDDIVDFDPLNPVKKGVFIDDVVAGPPLGQGEMYVCKMPNKSFIHLQQLNFNDISNTKANNPYSMYQKAVSRQFEVTFSTVKGFTEPVSKILDPNVFFAERIVTHQCDEELLHVVEQHIDMSHYLPGLPIDNSQDLQQFLRFQKPLQSIFEHDDYFVGHDGSFILEPKPLNQEIIEVDEKETNAEADDTPPPKTKFLIKWKNLPLSKATWETPESLSEGPICPGNFDEIKEMIRNYWHRLKHQDTEKEIHSDDTTKIINLKRGFSLSKHQLSAVKKLMTAFLHYKLINLQCNDDAGRTLVISSLLQTLRFSFHHKRPALIICHPIFTYLWENTFRMMTNLQYATLGIQDRDRQLHKQWEVSGDSVSKFDVLIASSFIIETEASFLTGLNFETVIVDTRHSVSPAISALIEGDHRNIYLSPTEIENATAIKLPSTPFTYTERLFMEENLTKPVLNTFITDILKSKQNPQTIEPIACDMFNLTFSIMDHVSLSPQMNEISNRIFRSKHSIGKRQFTPQENTELLEEFSSKLTRLKSLLRDGGLQIIIGRNYDILRIIRQYLGDLGILSTWLNSNILNEQPSLVSIPETGVVLMVRNEYSNIISQLKPTRIIFYDLPGILRIDVDLVHFFMRGDNKPEVVRLITKDSLESVIYSQLLRVKDLNLSLLTSTDCEVLMRAITLTSKPARETPSDLPSELSFTFPTDIDQIPEKIDKTMEFVKSCQNYWEEIFPSPSGQPLKQCSWAQQEAQALLDMMLTMVPGSWDNFAGKFNYPVNEIREIGHAITLHHLTRLYEEDFINYSVAIASFHIDYFGWPYESPVTSPKTYWNDIAMRDTTYPASLFVMKGMQKIFANATRLFSIIQRCIFIRAFMYLNPEPTLPARSRIAANYTPEFVYKVLNIYLNGSTTYFQISQQIPNFTGQDFDTIFKVIYPQIKCEVLMHVTKMISSGETDTEIKELRPIMTSMIFGPFYFGWTEQHVFDVLRGMALYGIPVAPNTNTPDYSMFAAMLGITGRSIDMINSFMEMFYAMLISSHSAHESMIVPETLTLIKPQVHTVKGKEIVANPTVPFEVIDRTIRSIDMIGFARKTLREKTDKFMSQTILPPNWTHECDIALLEGIVQYGLDARGQLAQIPYKPPRETFYDLMMSTNLSQFADVFTTDFASKRLSFLILTASGVPRKIRFWDHGVRHLSIQIQSRQDWENDMKQLEKEYHHEYLIKYKEDMLINNPQLREYFEEKEKEKKRVQQEKQAEKIKPKVKKASSKNISRGLSPPPQKKTSRRRSMDPDAEQSQEKTPEKMPVPQISTEKPKEKEVKPKEEEKPQTSQTSTPPKPKLRLKPPKHDGEESSQQTSQQGTPEKKKRPMIKLNYSKKSEEEQKQQQTQTEEEKPQQPKKKVIYIDAMDIPDSDDSNDDGEDDSYKRRSHSEKSMKKQGKEYLEEMNRRANASLRDKKQVQYREMDEDEPQQTRFVLKKRSGVEKKMKKGEDTPTDQNDKNWKKPNR